MDPIPQELKKYSGKVTKNIGLKRHTMLLSQIKSENNKYAFKTTETSDKGNKHLNKTSLLE